MPLASPDRILLDWNCHLRITYFGQSDSLDIPALIFPDPIHLNESFDSYYLDLNVMVAVDKLKQLILPDFTSLLA
jgi:hypothetical protein